MNLDAYMTTAGLTDRRFAELIGVDRATVSRWRRGKIKPSWVQIARIGDVTKGKVTANDFTPVRSMHREHTCVKRA